MLKSIRSFLFCHHIYIIIICILPIIAMTIWHIFDISLPVDDGSGYFFRSYSHAQHFFIAENNFFESIRDFFKHLFFERGTKPILFPAIGLPAVFLSFGDFQVGYLLLNISYLIVIIYYSYLLILEFSKNKLFAAISASIIGISPAVFDQAIYNHAEIAITMFILPFFYYLHKSNYLVNKNYSYLFAISFALLFAVRPLLAFLITLVPILFYFYSGYKAKIFTSKSLITITYLIFVTVVVLFTIPHLKNIGSSVYIEHMNWGDHSEQIYFLESLYYNLTFILYGAFIFINYLIYKKNKYKFLHYKNIKLNYKNNDSYLISSISLFLVLIIIIWGYQLNDLINWIYGATFGSMISAQPALNNNLSFMEKLYETLVWNGVFTFYALFFIFSLFFILNNFKMVISNFTYVILSSLPVFLILLFSSQSDPYRFATGFVILFILLLILIGSLKRYFPGIIFILILFLVSKNLIFYDHHFSISKINYINLAASIGAEKHFRNNISREKTATFLALDIIRNYHKKYNFKKIYVDGHSKWHGKNAVDSYKIRNYLEYHPEKFRVDAPYHRKYNDNSYKELEERHKFDFMFLTNPLLHDDGSKEYHDKLNYYLSCNNTSDPCNIAPGSLYSFRLHVDLANKIANGTISETNWELIDTINIYSYDVFILRLKNE